MTDLTPEVLDMMQQLYEMHSSSAVERFADCLQRYAPALLAAARERDRMRGVLADSASAIAELKHRIAQLEATLGQSTATNERIHDEMAQRIAELEEALANAIEHVRLWSGNGETDNRARWSKALAGKGGGK